MSHARFTSRLLTPTVLANMMGVTPGQLRRIDKSFRIPGRRLTKGNQRRWQDCAALREFIAARIDKKMAARFRAEWKFDRKKKAIERAAKSSGTVLGERELNRIARESISVHHRQARRDDRPHKNPLDPLNDAISWAYRNYEFTVNPESARILAEKIEPLMGILNRIIATAKKPVAYRDMTTLGRAALRRSQN